MAQSKMDNVVNLLICGDVNGKFNSLFNRIAKLNHAKGPFEALFCVGNFFSDQHVEFKSMGAALSKCPIPCYILGPCKAEHVKYFSDCERGGELASNIIYLGKSGILTMASGLTIAYLSGIQSTNQELYSFNAGNITSLQDQFQALMFKGVDILLTSPWPKDVTKALPVSEQISSEVLESELISYLAITLKPCYHFSGLNNLFYSRHPYRNTKSSNDFSVHPTKFLGLAHVGNTNRMKFLYGLQHVPLQKQHRHEKKYEILTECPYTASDNFQNSQLTCTSNLLHVGSDKISKDNKNKSNKDGKRIKHSEDFSCWFCLALKVEEHLIVSTGNDCYITLAKGGIVDDHFLLIPNAHYKCAVHLPDYISTEIEYFKYFLKCFNWNVKNKSTLFYERNFKSPHMQLQVIAIPEELAENLESSFINAANSCEIFLEEIPPETDIKQICGQKQYFYLEIESKLGFTKRFLHLIENDFPMDFPRNILAKSNLLNVPNRVDWRKCSLELEEEKTVCKKLRCDLQQYLKSENIIYQPIEIKRAL